MLAAGSWLLAERFFRKFLQSWLTAGYRGNSHSPLIKSGRWLWIFTLLTAITSLGFVILWSFAWRWRYPDILPSIWSLKVWLRYFPRLLDPLTTTLSLATASTLAGLLLSIFFLEKYPRDNNLHRKAIMASFYLPLLLPQMTFLLGIHSVLLALQADGIWITVMFSHLLFVFPYCYLNLAGFWKQYDQRYSQAGLLLSGSRLRTFVQIKLPMLLPSLLTTLALGIAVSTALYLPTIMMGAGPF